MGKKSRRNRGGGSGCAKKSIQKAPNAAANAACRSDRPTLNFDNFHPDCHKYLVARTDFRRLTRWPNDGIEQDRARHLDGRVGSCSHDTDDPEQIALAELLAGYICSETPLADMDKTRRELLLSLPFIVQIKAADDQGDPAAAIEHFLEAYRSKDEAVRSLVERIGCKGMLHKAARDPSRFPDLRVIIFPLFRLGLASDANVILLFGDISRVRALLIEVGCIIIQPPPARSPAGWAMQKQVFAPKAKAKRCAECGSTEQDALMACACKATYYCSEACQRANLALHKPECCTMRGIPVSDRMRAKAAREIEWRSIEEEEKRQRDVEKFRLKVVTAVNAFPYEDRTAMGTMAHNCFGEFVRADLPWCGVQIEAAAAELVGLQPIEVLALEPFPDGVPAEVSGLGLLVSDPENGAKIMILHEPLFADGGNVLCGHAIDGLYVVGQIVQEGEKKRAKWRSVPDCPANIGRNRFERLIARLQRAKDEAIAVANNVDLKIRNAEDSGIPTTPTPFGYYTPMCRGS